MCILLSRFCRKYRILCECTIHHFSQLIRYITDIISQILCAYPVRRIRPLRPQNWLLGSDQKDVKVKRNHLRQSLASTCLGLLRTISCTYLQSHSCTCHGFPLIVNSISFLYRVIKLRNIVLLSDLSFRCKEHCCSSIPFVFCL